MAKFKKVFGFEFHIFEGREGNKLFDKTKKRTT